MVLAWVTLGSFQSDPDSDPDPFSRVQVFSGTGWGYHGSWYPEGDKRAADFEREVRPVRSVEEWWESVG